MEETTTLAYQEGSRDDQGCAYVLDGSDGRRTCGAQKRSLSSYCAAHHARCHIPWGSRAETSRLREVEALASAVGGRRARDGTGPSRQFLKRLEQAVQTLS